MQFDKFVFTFDIFPNFGFMDGIARRCDSRTWFAIRTTDNKQFMNRVHLLIYSIIIQFIIELICQPKLQFQEEL